MCNCFQSQSLDKDLDPKPRRHFILILRTAQRDDYTAEISIDFPCSRPQESDSYFSFRFLLKRSMTLASFPPMAARASAEGELGEYSQTGR